ncbi:uncharacterized protein LOC131670377 [Phymastichus coffea]|uniref:uncharacterized protein LOC131670377 n=1 Tax=Phymastichus coffea TaxID=108790 RepID=UPI00273BD24B|nr:uncharacterized protein LOC131670377 [Phymastichus coffea]
MLYATIIFLVTITSSYAKNSTENSVAARMSFAIDYENNQFLLDGRPFRYVSGSFHYFRTPREYWRDRLRKMRAAGLNAISTYVEWSFHQPEPNKWIWNGDADLVEFIKQAQDEDLLVLLRPGPYICAERDFGGFPYWLLTLVPDIKLRTNDLRYLQYAEEYLNQVLTRVTPLLRGNGGPIIMVQVENEYGSFDACDKHYTKRLRDIIKNHVQDNAVLYTTDGAYRQALRCGPIPGVYATVDFGTATNITQNFKYMREIEPKGPLVNSEFYPGWLSHWEEPFQRVETKRITKMLDDMLSLGASVNFYMFYGGTNFAFTAGSNIFKNYTPDLTSYDYDAPLTEAGDPTSKYFEIRKTISKYLPLPNIPIPPVSLKGEYGIVKMRPVLRLFDPEARSLFGTEVVYSKEPLTFEALNIPNWLVLYEANLPSFDISNNNAILKASPKDRALIYFDGEFAGTFSRTHNVKSRLLGPTNAKSLQILVENQGRVNFGNVDVEDFKGIFNVTLNDVTISPWNITGFRFDTIFESILTAIKSPTAEMETLVSGPQILIGHFDVIGVPRDTYLNTAEWGKGAAFVNDRNLGRYWPLVGPQMTLYVPAAYLKEGKNTLVLVELEYVPVNRKINFQTVPVLDYTNNATKVENVSKMNITNKTSTANMGYFWIVFCLFSLLGSNSSAYSSENNNMESYSFEIDYENDQFLLDGKPFRYVSGSFHYFRAPRQNWRNILRKMRAAGLNAVSTYVEWSMHEPEFNKWVWDGDADIIEFINIAQEEDLLVILRPGPYICAERDFGGFPYWLLNRVPDIRLRTRDERYIYYAERFLNQILGRTKHLLRGNGGPIIMVQVENEYGSFYSCDDVYKAKLYDIFHRHVKDKAVLFTTDGPNSRMMQCGGVPETYGTVDFGSGANVKLQFKLMRKHTPKGPYVNSEYYPGWLTHWGENFQRVGTEGVAQTLDEMLAYNASVNFYMFYGGTNFGFTSGANINENYWPQITSYDYDAPLTEAGDPTPKYFQLRKVISKYLPLPNLEIPTVASKGNYGAVNMKPMLDLFTKEGREIFGTPRSTFVEPPTFESLGLPNWLVLYEANLPLFDDDENNVVLEALVKDRALVYIDHENTGVMNRMDKSYTLPLAFTGRKLQILVENLGRVNYGDIDTEDFKGIFDVSANNITITSWDVTGFKLNSVTDNFFSQKKTAGQIGKLSQGPQFLVGYFDISGKPLDTYLNTEGWGKGVIYINGHNLGRYWTIGPQITLYVPAAFLKSGKNNLVVLELEKVPEGRKIEFQITPFLDYSSDYLDFI